MSVDRASAERASSDDWPRTPPRPAPSRTSRSGRPVITVMIVDDNEDHRHLMARRLSEAGYIVLPAASAAEALEVAGGADLVLLDNRLPGSTGIEVLGDIRQRGPSVIMVTGVGSETLAVEAMRQGAVDYVVKNPGYLAELPGVVERAWRHHDLEQRARQLQRLTLLVSSAHNRDSTFGEIVEGAKRLLRADACALFVSGGAGVKLEAFAGDDRHRTSALREAAVRVLTSPAGADADGQPTGAGADGQPTGADAADPPADAGADGQPTGAGADEQPTVADADDPAGGATTAGGRLLVPIPSPDGSPLGVLIVVGQTTDGHLPEEVALARTFASYAGMALTNLDRLELERSLVAELQQMLELRRTLVASVSHELRTPLTCIVGFTATLLRRWSDLDDVTRVDILERIDRSSHDLSDLVEQLLDFAAVEAGRVEMQTAPVELAGVVESVLGDLSPLLVDRTVHRDLDHARVEVDASLLRRILANLVSNAAKYSEPGTPVTVRARVDGQEVRVEVVDQGPGLTAEEVAQVFNPFWRAKHSVAGLRGTGIGLTLVQDYVRRMGGQVSVDSSPGAGSTFAFTVPLTR